jgi:hypothetical protein
MSFVTSSLMSIIFDAQLERWNAVDLEFFDSTYDEKILVTAKFMQHVEKDIYFRDVHLFLDRVKDFVMTKEVEIVRNNLYTCLRESVMTWYTIEVFEKKKKFLKMKNNIDVWKRYLLKRFRERLNVTMITIIRKRYILKNARRRRESRKYAGIIMKAAKFAELRFEAHQIMLIYNDLDLKFQRNILMPELITNIQNFLQCLDDKKNIWWELINRQFTRFDTTRIRNSYNTYDQFKDYYQSVQQHFDQYDFQNATQRIDQWNSINLYRFSYQFESANQLNQSQSQIQNAKQLNASKSQLQITVDSSKEFAFSSKSNLFRSTENFSFRSNNYMSTEQEDYDSQNRFFERAWNNQNRNNYNRDRAQKVYIDAIEKNNDDQNNSQNYQNQKHHENQNSDFITNENNKKNEISYQVKNNSELFSSNQKYSYFLNENEYHIDIEVIQNKINVFKCRRCKTKFLFNNKLHRHVRECRRSIFVESLESHQIDAFHIDDLSERIIVFTTKSDLIRDLIFRFWHFVIFFARLFSDESLNELCADSDCIMSLIDRIYLRKTLLSVKIFHTDSSVTIRNIEIVTHNCFEYVHLKVFILESKRIAKLNRQAHVVDNLRAKFLMNMNILEPKEIILNFRRRKMTLSSCENLKVDIRITSKSITLNITSVNQIILTERLVSIFAKFVVTVSIKMKSTLSDRDFLFQSICRDLNLDQSDEIMTYIVSVNVVAVQVCNFIDESVIISRRARLDRIIEYEEHECYFTNSEKASLIAESTWKKSKSSFADESFRHKTFALTNIHICQGSAFLTSFIKVRG